MRDRDIIVRVSIIIVVQYSHAKRDGKGDKEQRLVT
jgi:hypothetical protein